MNILVESGATKSTCIGYNDACTFFHYKTTGINATYAPKEKIIDIFKEIIAKNNIVVAEIENIHYYGAGCFKPDNAAKVKEALSCLFPKTNITVLSDLHATCLALCNSQKGFSGILGTGSASCFYDGENIIDKAPSLGFLIGDEGSGTHIGKLFVKEYLTDNLDPDIAQNFEDTFMFSKTIVFTKMYQEENPQAFFASIPPFLQKHIDNKQIKKIIANSFQDFFDKQIDYYGKFPYPWFFCGSIAYFFQDILIKTARKNSIKIEKIIQECAPALLYNTLNY
ncbi:MAG: hypothetical protein LBU83_04565 [Bacteroidales bacterium]|jgi:N-acetylglucosamine kinase-like BadF-type ATPase|nr:hypothetical protein [Bacteroidales bacterium]